MSFYREYTKYTDFNFQEFLTSTTQDHIQEILAKNRLDQWDFLRLLSPVARKYLEAMAERAHQLTLQHFGKTVQLYTPLYLANHCVNRCAYCGFSVDQDIKRKQLTLEEIREEGANISKTGLRHILLLTGESKKETPLSYIIQATKVLKEYFDSIAIEIYPLTTEEYKEVIDAGVDSLTIYQEVYDEKIYDKVHLGGPKKNYRFRLDAPERGCQAKMHQVNIGALLGLHHWTREAFFTGLHAHYLERHYGDVELGISLPRIRPCVGSFTTEHPVEDATLVQIMLALRLYLPRIGVNLSTRESAFLRDHLLPLGVTKMSAGVSTEVGGHTSEDKSTSQFEISDGRSVGEIKDMLLSKGYQPVFKDWMQL